MADTDEIEPLGDKEKKKFVKNMMELANKAKQSSEEEVYAKMNKEIKRREYYEFVFYIIFFIITVIIVYLNVR